jgi:hypothetical protein
MENGIPGLDPHTGKESAESGPVDPIADSQGNVLPHVKEQDMSLYGITFLWGILSSHTAGEGSCHREFDT